MAQTHTNLGFALLSMKRDPEEQYRKAIGYSPTFIPAYTGLGEVLEAKGKMDDARNVLTKATMIHPFDAGVYMNLGVMLQHAKENEDALKVLKIAAQLSPQDGVIHDNIGVTLVALDKKELLEEARASFKTAVRLSPTRGSAHAGLGVVSQTIGGEMKQACLHFIRAAQLNPEAYMQIGKQAAGWLKKNAGQAADSRGTAPGAQSQQEKVHVILTLRICPDCRYH